MKSTKENLIFLQGGGEMGKLIREKNWDKTPLGDPGSWPQILRTMVSVMLDNPFGMYIAWGKNYTQIYNDGYRPILGATKHPMALGIGTMETFSEISHIITPMFEGVMNGVPVGFPDLMLPLNRNGFVEECYFDFAYSPIRLENGEVGGVLVTVVETTNRKKAELELKASEQKFKAMADNIPNLAWMAQPDGWIYWYNKKWYEYTGTSPEEMQGWGWQSVHDPEVLPQVIENWKYSVDTGTPFEMVFPLKAKDGQFRQFLTRVLPVKDDDGNIIQWFGSNTDITDQKETEAELKDSKNELEFVIEAAQLGTFDFSPITGYFAANDRMKAWFGLPPDENIAFNKAMVAVAAYDRQRVLTAFQKSLSQSSDGKYDIEYTIVNPLSLKEIILHAKGQAWFNKENIAYRINGTLEDVTNKTLSQRKIAQSEQNLSNMILEAPIGICVMNATTQICEIVNDRFLEIAGKPHDKIVKHNYWETFAESKDYFGEPLEAVVQTGVPYHANEVGVKIMRHGKEETIYVTFVYAPLKDEMGSVSKIAVWVVDNTMQVLARQKVTYSESNLRMMILQAPIAIAILRDDDYKVEIANKHALELWGRTEEEVSGKPAFEAMPELLTQGIKALLDEVKNTGIRFSTAELPIQLVKKGVLETIYINFSYEPLYDVEEKINGIMAIGFDVTPQVLARKKVEDSEQSVRALVEGAPFPIGVYTGEEMRIAFANQSIMNAWGKGNDVIGKLYTEILPELENQQIFDQVRAVFSTGIPFHAQNQKVDLVVNGDVKSYYFNYSFTPLLDTFGKVYGVMNTAADVTELHEAKQKVEKSEKRFRDSVQQAPLGIAIFRGPDYITEMANENYLLLVDKTENEFIGKPLFEAIPEMQSLVAPLFREVINSGNPFYSPDLPVTLKRYGHIEEGYFNLVYHPLKEESGDISGIMVVATEVTKTVQAKLLLQESEQQFRNMVMLSPIAMTILKGKNFIIESANKVMYENVWRKTEAEVIGRSLLEVFPELAEQKYPELLNEVFKTGITHTEKESAAYVRGNDGLRKFYFDFEYAPLVEPNGEVSGIMITVNDVTDKVEARQKVEEAEERSRLAAEATELATWELDLETRHMIHTPRLAQIYGHHPTRQLTHLQVREQIVAEDRKNIVEKAFNQALSTGTYFFEARLLKADNSPGWIKVQGKAIYNEHQQATKMVGTLRDITEEKQFQQVLLEREQKFRLLADSMPQFIWTADPDGDLNYFNQSLINFSGLTHEQLNNNGWLQIVHPDDREENTRRWKESVSTGADFLLEHRFKRYDGEYRWQLSRAIPQLSEEGVIQMWVGSSTDIQEIKEQEQQKDYFISVASHELKTPITSIKGYVQILQSMNENKGDPFLLNSLETMDKQINTLTKLISELLDVSKIKSGGLELKKEYFEIGGLVNEVVAEIKHINPGYYIPVVLQGKASIYGDRDRIGQVLRNLLTNAVKYAPESKEIRVTCQVEQGNAVVSVEDFGIGISKKNQERVFERFYRVEGTNESTFPGFGIGLFIAHEIINRHQGKFVVNSELGRGSVFAFSLPVSETAADR